MRNVDRVSGAVVDCAFFIHTRLGPGLLESVYESILGRRLMDQGFRVEKQKAIDFAFDGHLYKEAFRIDLLVDGVVVVELKSVERMAPVHWKQVLTYLRLTEFEVGLLINFGAPTLKEGLHRVVNNYTPSAPPRLRVRKEAAAEAELTPSHTCS